MRTSSAELARNEILSFFDDMKQQVFILPELDRIFKSKRAEWALPKSMTTRKFIQFLVDRGKLSVYEFPFNWQPTILFAWESPSIYEIASQLAPNGYLSHLTAMQIHNLIDKDLGKTVYTNAEQTPKPARKAKLEQSRIDAAFKRPPRITNNRIHLDEYTFCLISGKHTGMLGVTVVTIPELAVPIRVTSLERTLVDIVVRPAYSGGVYGILEAYRRASATANVELIAETLDGLEYTYPYHQAIGFFMEQSHSYTESQIDVFRRYEKQYDFYVDYEMLEPEFSPSWRVYYPNYLHIE